MKQTIAQVDGRTINTYKMKGCPFCGPDCRDIYTDKTTGKKYVINIDNGEIVVEEYEEEEEEESGSEEPDTVGSAVVGQAHVH